MVAGVLQNNQIRCTIGSDVFWIINNSVYGHLQVPTYIVLCSTNRSCEPNILTIPVALAEMDGYTFQCLSVDYCNNTLHMGERVALEVLILPEDNFYGNATGTYNCTTTQMLNELLYIRHFQITLTRTRP